MSREGSSIWLAGVRTLLDQLEATQGPAIEALAIAGCDSISRGGIVHVAGTGHSAIIPLEAFHRAGGLAAMNPLWDPATLPPTGAPQATLLERDPARGAAAVKAAGIKPGELLIVVSQSGINGAPVETAIAGAAAGAIVGAFVSLPHSSGLMSRHPSGKTLAQVATHVIDTGVPRVDALLPRPDGSTALAASTMIFTAAWY
ncbi:MAG: sugar isomerase domain-containing protein, partial [Candidatus Limnocylindrus sp.]